VRELAPDLPLLVPGVGAQGGDAKATVQAACPSGKGRTNGGLMVNSSRAVLYASEGADFAAAARQVALETRQLLRDARQ
jgi:orotidine-5'-phosphate decarboxylase